MDISKEEIVHLAYRVITDSFGIPHPLARGLADQVASYLMEKAIAPTADAINDYVNKIMNEQHKVDVLSPEELIEKANKDSAKEAGIQVAQSHVDLFMKIRSELQIESDQLLLSSNVNKNSTIPSQVKQQIIDLQTKFGKIIKTVATHIEEKKYESAEKAIADMQSNQQISSAQQKVMQKLVDADKSFHISCQSLKVTVDFFIALNEHIVEEIEKCEDIEQESRLVLGNAVLVYELTDFVLKYLQSFKAQGVSDIDSVKKEIEQKINRIQTEINELKDRANRDGIFPELKENILSNISEREQAVEVMEQSWQEYLQEVKSISEESTGFVAQWVPNLELIRDDAKNQIAVFEVLTIARVLRSNLIALKTAVTRLENLKLVSLSPDRVRRLFGI